MMRVWAKEFTETIEDLKRKREKLLLSIKLLQDEIDKE